ncbi:methyltransferase family protein [Natronomonas amylolytica]|uniref:methyltransferase family protein n=1 Tax=Natronomonas amylolytica TaxID=3108498 RepID=UPI003008F67D
MALAGWLFALGSAAAVCILATLLATTVGDVRFWPPGETAWKARLHWGLVTVFNIALVGTAVLDWNSWVLPRPTSLVIGVGLALVGAVVFGYSVRVMDAEETSGGNPETLYTDGPYARSRNPQYVGMIIGITGFALLVNAPSVAGLAILHIFWVVLLPFAEEPWLREQFGEEYDRYRERVPRFIGFRTFRPAASSN